MIIIVRISDVVAPTAARRSRWILRKMLTTARAKTISIPTRKWLRDDVLCRPLRNSAAIRNVTRSLSRIVLHRRLFARPWVMHDRRINNRHVFNKPIETRHVFIEPIETRHVFIEPIEMRHVQIHREDEKVKCHVRLAKSLCVRQNENARLLASDLRKSSSFWSGAQVTRFGGMEMRGRL
mmetsp:Transcript_2141/g.4785  ORF Transcript_2141/g.4785 Transcript_2141/m.4785 type:complete len:180 (+) Transcript_2141:1813-2352(+)